MSVDRGDEPDNSRVDKIEKYERTCPGYVVQIERRDLGRLEFQAEHVRQYRHACVSG